MALATAWSPAFPFGAAADPATDLSPGTIRDTIADMVRPHRGAQMRQARRAGRGDLREMTGLIAGYRYLVQLRCRAARSLMAAGPVNPGRQLPSRGIR
jgi:hypothetical protein